MYVVLCCVVLCCLIAGFAPDVKSDGEAVLPDSDPHWGIDVAFNKGTTLCYGPWVDRQR